MDAMSLIPGHFVRGVFAAGLFVVAASAQAPSQPSPGVAPNAANHFVETPKGWVHPRTAWGEPDLEGTWPIPAGIDLVRGPNSCPANPPRGRGAGPATPNPNTPPPPLCDPTTPFLSEAEYKVVMDRHRLLQKEGDGAAKALAAGNVGAALMTGTTDPQTPLRQRSTIVDPPNGQLPDLMEEGKRRSAMMKSSWSLGPQEKQI